MPTRSHEAGLGPAVLVASSLPHTRAALVAALNGFLIVEVDDEQQARDRAPTAAALLCTPDLAGICLAGRSACAPVLLVHFEALPRPVVLPGGVLCVPHTASGRLLERLLSGMLKPVRKPPGGRSPVGGADEGPERVSRRAVPAPPEGWDAVQVFMGVHDADGNSQAIVGLMGLIGIAITARAGLATVGSGTPGA